MRIRAKDWNEQVKQLRNRRLMPGLNTRLAWTSRGQILNANNSGQWQHPWTILPGYFGGDGWRAGVAPGLVNGIPPVMLLPAAQAPAATLARLKKAGSPARPQDTVKSPLQDLPSIPLDFRAIGFDDTTAQNPVPAFFKNKVAPAPPLPSADDIANGTSETPDAPAKNNQLLRACDIVLHMPSNALTANIDSNGIVTLGFNLGSAGDELKVYAAAQYASLVNAGIDPLSGDYEEPNFVEQVIGTVYLLSPPGTPLHSAPTAAWKPYVQHNLFWNLSYVEPRADIGLIGDGLFAAFQSLALLAAVLSPGTAVLTLGLAQLAGSDLSQILAELEAQSLNGAFYTPGCGSAPAFDLSVADMVSVTNYGLNKDARNAAGRRTVNTPPKPLDPAFPYANPLSFSVGFLS